MSLLNRGQRAVIVADTGIDPLIVDRATDAFDALVDRGDTEAYRQAMAHAWAQMGFGLNNPIRSSDRPTALDKIKTILIKAYADREHIDFKRAATKLKRMLEG